MGDHLPMKKKTSSPVFIIIISSIEKLSVVFRKNKHYS